MGSLSKKSGFPFLLLLPSILFFFPLWAAGNLHAQGLRDRGTPRVYTGKHLEAVGMPVGGIGTGDIWIAGDGTLSAWQIFNNLTERARLPHSFFAVRARAEGEAPALCSLDEDDRLGFLPLEVVSFRGDYPFAWLKFASSVLPVEVSMRVFNPMIPLDVKDSSIPCALYRLTARNTSGKAAEVSFAAMLQNAVGYDGYGEIAGRRFAGYGGNVNALERGGGFARFLLSVPDHDGPRLAGEMSLLHAGAAGRPLAVCSGLKLLKAGKRGPAPAADAVWIDGIGPGTDSRLVAALARVAAEGGCALLKAPSAGFLDLLRRIGGASGEGGWKPGYVLFEDFESGSYEGWTREGEAFGDAPSGGTEPGQNPVAGFMGKGLVNTYRPDDKPMGSLTSRPFTIEHRYIAFLVGGGAHRGKTCIDLKVDGKAVRTATGINDEYLKPVQWDVGDLLGKEAVIEIEDRYSGGWGHINVDRIVFGDDPPVAVLGKEESFAAIAAALPGGFFGKAEGGGSAPGSRKAEEPGIETFSFGKGRLILAGAGADDLACLGAIAAACGKEFTPGRGLPEDASAFGDMCLSVFDGGATASAGIGDLRALADDLLDDGRLSGPDVSDPSPAGETRECALAVPFTLEPGAERSVDFAITWCFPNLERYGHKGNLYAAWYPSAAAAEAYARENFDRLEKTTLLYHDTLYATNLPYWMIDCLSSQSCIFRTVLCFYAARHAAVGKPYFAGYEGCYGCCPLNCTHVWNYAQTHARLFPSIGRNLRWYDFMHYLKPDGETQHRQHAPHGAFIDGHCAVIEGALREHLTSPGDSFLREIWPKVKKAVEWLIEKIDPDEDGVNAGHQWNTYDVATSGAQTFIGSQYLSALAAAERMARLMGDDAFAERCARIREAGSRNQDRLLWRDDYGYYIQIPDKDPARDYGTGCHSDQLLGQWWSFMLDDGFLYPEQHVKKALESIYKYNLRRDFYGFEQRPRRYVEDGEGGLLMCTWPNGGRPDPFILYADEVWTGIEYEAAALMIYEGMIDEGFRIVKTARDRYDGRIRKGLNSGPGGNPFCDLECGRFYARALSSWSLLLAAQGFVYDGPARRIGFLPRWKPEEHASFFTAAEGWGLFRQTIAGRRLRASIEVRWGRLPVREVVLGWRGGEGIAPLAVVVRLDGAPLRVEGAGIAGGRLSVTLAKDVVVAAGGSLRIEAAW